MPPKGTSKKRSSKLRQDDPSPVPSPVQSPCGTPWSSASAEEELGSTMPSGEKFSGGLDNAGQSPTSQLTVTPTVTEEVIGVRG